MTCTDHSSVKWMRPQWNTRFNKSTPRSKTASKQSTLRCQLLVLLPGTKLTRPVESKLVRTSQPVKDSAHPTNQTTKPSPLINNSLTLLERRLSQEVLEVSMASRESSRSWTMTTLKLLTDKNSLRPWETIESPKTKRRSTQSSRYSIGMEMERSTMMSSLEPLLARWMRVEEILWP